MIRHLLVHTTHVVNLKTHVVPLALIQFTVYGNKGEECLMDEANRGDPPNWIQQHAVYQELMHLDVGDSAQVYAAFLVYMELTEVRKWKEVVGVSCPELQAVLLEGREREGEALQMIYPLPSHRSIKHRELRTILDRGVPMLLCAVASDSSLVYQRLCDGFLTPDPPVDIQDQGRRQHRKRRLQT